MRFMTAVVPSTGLKEDEKVLWSGKPRLTAFIGRLILSVILIFLGVIPVFGWILAIIGLAILIYTILKVRGNTYLITNMRVIREYRLGGRNIEETTLDHVTDIVLHQGFLGRIFNFGTVHIHTAGTGFIGIDFEGVKDPMTVRGTIINAKDAYRHKPRLEYAVRYCPNCGAQLTLRENFCPNCGQKIK